MVLLITTCAACAKPLAHNAPPCERCKTRYCDRTCYLDHWRRGHKQICKRINDLREGVETLEDTVRIARRVLGNSHPTVAGIEESLGHFQAALNTIIT